jgi:hypothetical protein
VEDYMRDVDGRLSLSLALKLLPQLEESILNLILD